MGDRDRPLHAYRGFNAPPEHVPAHPSWECKACWADWPCAAARQQMRREYFEDPSALSVLMWRYMDDWIVEAAGPGPLRDAWDRFLAWTRW
jgi:hypothetical protein